MHIGQETAAALAHGPSLKVKKWLVKMAREKYRIELTVNEF